MTNFSEKCYFLHHFTAALFTFDNAFREWQCENVTNFLTCKVARRVTCGSLSKDAFLGRNPVLSKKKRLGNDCHTYSAPIKRMCSKKVGTSMSAASIICSGWPRIPKRIEGCLNSRERAEMHALSTVTNRLFFQQS
jgi:hypothetical protein